MGKALNGPTHRIVAKQESHLLCKQRILGAQRSWEAEAHATLAPVLSHALVWLKLEKPLGINLHNQGLFYNTQRDWVKVTRHL